MVGGANFTVFLPVRYSVKSRVSCSPNPLCKALRSPFYHRLYFKRVKVSYSQILFVDLQFVESIYKLTTNIH